MDTQKFTIGTLVGGIVYFLLGYLVYGLLLAGFFQSHSVAVAGSMKKMEEFVWWALILGNFAGAALLTYIFLKIGNINSFASGARIGLAVGFFVVIGSDLIRYATENAIDITALVVNAIVGGAIMFAIVGGVIAAVLGRGKKA